MKNVQPELFERLMSFAMNYCRADRDLAEEAAADSLLACVEKDVMTFNYGAACVKNYIAEHYRRRKSRGDIPLIEEDDETGEYRIRDAVVPAAQGQAMLVGECLGAIENLSDKIRPVMRYVAQEWTADEIAQVLDLPKSEVVWRTKYGRKILREMSGYGFDAKRGHNRFIGVRRKHQVWEASIRSGESFVYLGHYETASQAAAAYDAAAKKLHGEKAKLNFPDAPCAH